MNEGKLVAIEGPDTSSLTYYTRILADYLMINNIPVVVFQEPTIGPIGVHIKAYEESRIDYHPLPLSILRLADRLDQQTLKKDGVLSYLASGVTVIKIHYLLTAYTEFGDAISLDWLKQINNICNKPDIILYHEPENDLNNLYSALTKKYTYALENCPEFAEKLSIFHNLVDFESIKNKLLSMYCGDC